MSYFYMLGKLYSYTRHNRWRIPVYFLFHVTSLLMILLQPYVFGKICDNLQSRTPSLISNILFWLTAYIMLYLIFNLFHRVGRFIEQRISFRARQNFINEMYKKILSLPIEWHDDNHTGNTINRIKLASDALFDFGEKQFQYIEYFIMFWGPLIAIFILSYESFLLAFCIALLIVHIIKKFDKRIVPLFQREAETQQQFLATFFDYINNIRTIITLRLQEKTEQGLNDKIEAAYPILIKSINFNQYKWAMVSLLIVILEISVIFCYISLTSKANSTIKIGAVVAIFQYLQQLGKMFFNIAAGLQEIVQLKVDFDAAGPIESAYSNLRNKSISGSLYRQIPWKLLQINNLSFSYQENRRKVLEQINLQLNSRSKVALVGESGSGKSTLLKILRGLYSAQIDHLFLDNDEYRDLSVISTTVTLIQQEAEIFENTIDYNVSVGTEADENEVKKAIQAARFEGVLEQLPEGLNTDIREKGVNLSGGERQRLALARGILAARESTILLLDEATSSVDIQNEMLIYENIFKLFKDKCVISSIHRLHFLDKFDIIYVMSAGKIVQQGKFAELKQQAGKFSELWEKYRKEKEEKS